MAFYTQTAPLIPLRELLAVYSNVSPSIFCNFPQTLVPPPVSPGYRKLIITNQCSGSGFGFSQFRIGRKCPSETGPRPLFSIESQNGNSVPKPSARNLSNPSFSSNLSNLCHSATSYPDPPSKLGFSLSSNKTSTNKHIEVCLERAVTSHAECQNVCIIDWLFFF